MTHPWDEFSKSLADESLPRRESLRRLGAAFAGAALMPFSLALGAPKAGGPDPCKTFCNKCSKSQQSQCLAACQACNGNTSRLCGTCGNYTCCSGSGMACCGGHCADLLDDVYNCGACGYACAAPGPYEDGACVNGTCLYKCVQGSLFCNGACTPVLSDPHNCGACGQACGGAAPFCDQGICTENAPCPGGQTRCNGACRDLANDPTLCGSSCETAVVCGVYEFCTGGVCEPAYD